MSTTGNAGEQYFENLFNPNTGEDALANIEDFTDFLDSFDSVTTGQVLLKQTADPRELGGIAKATASTASTLVERGSDGSVTADKIIIDDTSHAVTIDTATLSQARTLTIPDETGTVVTSVNTDFVANNTQRTNINALPDGEYIQKTGTNTFSSKAATSTYSASDSNLVERDSGKIKTNTLNVGTTDGGSSDLNIKTSTGASASIIGNDNLTVNLIRNGGGSDNFGGDGSSDWRFQNSGGNLFLERGNSGLTNGYASILSLPFDNTVQINRRRTGQEIETVPLRMYRQVSGGTTNADYIDLKPDSITGTYTQLFPALDGTFILDSTTEYAGLVNLRNTMNNLLDGQVPVKDAADDFAPGLTPLDGYLDNATLFPNTLVKRDSNGDVHTKRLFMRGGSSSQYDVQFIPSVSQTADTAITIPVIGGEMALVNDGIWTVTGSDIENSNSGNVGVGKSPDSGVKLDVDGAAQFTGTVTLTNAGPTLILRDTTDRDDVNIQFEGLSGTNQVNAKIGTSNDYLTLETVTSTNFNGIQLKGNNNLAMTVTNTGGISIGGSTVQASHSLDVFGNAIFRGTNTYQSQNIFQTRPDFYTGLRLLQGLYSIDFDPATLTANRTITLPDKSGTVALTSDLIPSNWVVTGNDIYAGNSGNVGIGTSSPDAKLHVYDDSTSTDIFMGSDGATNRAGIIRYIQGSGSPGSNARMYIGHYGDDLNTNRECLTVHRTGNTSVRTTENQHALNIGGKGYFTNQVGINYNVALNPQQMLTVNPADSNDGITVMPHTTGIATFLTAGGGSGGGSYGVTTSILAFGNATSNLTPNNTYGIVNGFRLSYLDTGNFHIMRHNGNAAANDVMKFYRSNGDVEVTSGDFDVLGGNLTVQDGTTTSGVRANVGVTSIGNGISNYAMFSHRNNFSVGNYALLQQSDGETFLNAASGRQIHFRINNATKGGIDGEAGAERTFFITNTSTIPEFDSTGKLQANYVSIDNPSFRVHTTGGTQNERCVMYSQVVVQSGDSGFVQQALPLMNYGVQPGFTSPNPGFAFRVCDPNRYAQVHVQFSGYTSTANQLQSVKLQMYAKKADGTNAWVDICTEEFYVNDNLQHDNHSFSKLVQFTHSYYSFARLLQVSGSFTGSTGDTFSVVIDQLPRQTR
jgi:hypothetical protein